MPSIPEDRPTLTVDPEDPGAYPTIGQALADAAPGTCVLVNPGHYQESLVISRPVILVANGPRDSVVVEAISQNCLAVDQAESDIEVRGFTFRCRSMYGGTRCYAVDIPVGHALLEDCVLASEGRSCIGIHGASAIGVLRRCSLIDGAESGALVYLRGRGLFEECDISGHRMACLDVRSGGTATVKGGVVGQGQQDGVIVHSGGKLTMVDRARVENNGYSGISVLNGGDVEVRDATVTGNQQAGIYGDSTAKGVVNGCDLSGNGKAYMVPKEAALHFGRNRTHRDASEFWLERILG